MLALLACKKRTTAMHTALSCEAICLSTADTSYVSCLCSSTADPADLAEARGGDGLAQDVNAHIPAASSHADFRASSTGYAAKMA